jgi:micrococcal nuclease
MPRTFSTALPAIATTTGPARASIPTASAARTTSIRLTSSPVWHKMARKVTTIRIVTVTHAERTGFRGVVAQFGAALAGTLVAVGLLTTPVAALADPVPADSSAVVLKVVDGDTIDILDDNRGRLRIRALGIDTPETKKPGYTVGCWGPEATEFARQTLVGQRVSVVYDPTQGLHDRYGRTLAYLVKGDGWDYSVEAARAGTAHSYVYDDTPVQRYPAIARAELEAKTALRGLWGPPCNGNTVSVPQ